MSPYPFPRDADVHRVWGWANVPNALANFTLESTAYHEAGHVVLLEWIGFDVKHAVVNQEKGLTFFDTPAVSVTASDAPTAPEHLASLVSIFHAGICAELIHAGIAWEGIVRRNDSDWKIADEILRSTFGSSSSGHGYAQRLALAVLFARWERVTEVAQEMIERGEWTSGELDLTSA